MTTVAPLRLPATCSWCGREGLAVWLAAGCAVVHDIDGRHRCCGAPPPRQGWTP